jgi:hypothetical protein
MGLQQLYLTGEDLESELDEKTKQMVDELHNKILNRKRPVANSDEWQHEPNHAQRSDFLG